MWSGVGVYIGGASKKRGVSGIILNKEIKKKSADLKNRRRKQRERD